MRGWLRERVPVFEIPSIISFPFTRTRGRRRRKEKKRKYILGKRPRERLLAADLLPADEGVDRDGDGAVDVLRRAVFRQAHLAKGLADAHDGFEVADLGGGLLVPFFFLI